MLKKIDYTKQYPEFNELEHISGNAFGTYNLARFLEHIHPFSINSVIELYRVTKKRLGITVDYGEDVEGLTQQQVKEMLIAIGIDVDVPDITSKEYDDGIKYMTVRRSILGIVIDK